MSVVKIIIEDGVTSIGDYAFRCCDNLTSITIPDSVTSIGEGAFSTCASLTSVTILSNAISIKRNAFYDCPCLTSVTISGMITDIENDAFKNTPWLEAKRTENPFVIVNGMLIDGKNNEGDIIIPDSVTDIGGGAFYDCRGLTSVTIPDSVTTIGKAAFYDCRGLTSVTIPDSVTTIGEEAFLFCKFTSITIPDSVTSIGEGAFRASELTTVTIPDSVTSIGICTFAACDSLTSINVDPENKYYASEDGLLCNKDKTLLIQFPIGKNKEEYTIPDCITTIEDYAFQGCDLTTVIIPDSVTSIGEYAFKYCSQLTKVKIPESVTTIESHAFYSCNNLTTITIPYCVTDLGQGAFFECTKLTSITIENPECKIHGWDSTIYKKATIYGYEGSTAQAYAEEYHMKFVALDATTTAGDANNDGKVLLNDAVLILQYLGNPDAYPLSDQAKANADVCNPGDGITNKDALAIQRYILKVIPSLPEYS
ncbi:MAG: leucine-rich repeat protein [Ruminococcus sp.]|nr:leucine-rich repeat protein [Ruminococcus sp.]